MDGGAWRAAVHRVAKSWTQLSDFTLLYFNVSAVSNSSSVKRALLTGKCVLSSGHVWV